MTAAYHNGESPARQTNDSPPLEHPSLLARATAYGEMLFSIIVVD